MSLQIIDSEIIKNTQDSLGGIIKKPPLTEKLLSKPPFRFLHDICTSVIKTTGFMKGLFNETEMNSDNVKEKEAKILFLQKVIDIISLVTGQTLSSKPQRMIAGSEAERTNEMLQCLALAIEKNVDNDEYVQKVLKNVPKDEIKTENGEERRKRKDRSSHKEERRKEDRKKDEKRNKEEEKENKKSEEKDDKRKKEERKRPEEGKVGKEEKKHRRREGEEKKDDDERKKRHHNSDSRRKKHDDGEDDKNRHKKSEGEDDHKKRGERRKEDKSKEDRKKEDKKEGEKISKKRDDKGESEERRRSREKRKSRHREERNEVGGGEGSGAKEGGSTLANNVSHGVHEASKHNRQPDSSNNARLSRPSSARPAPPKAKKKEEEEPILVSQNTSIIFEKKAEVVNDDDDDDDDDYIIKDDGTQLGDETAEVEATHDMNAEDHGNLVKNILETKKEYESTYKNTLTNDAYDGIQKKEKEVMVKEIEGIREMVQLSTKSINPLGKTMDFLQEDMDSMLKELNTWNDETKANQALQQNEESKTETALEPLKGQLKELDQAILAQLNLIDGVKSNIINNDYKISTLFSSIFKP